MDLKFQISWYVETWARLCSVAFKDEDYRQEKHTWIEWYEITKSKFAECDDNRQAELMQFFTEQLMDSIEGIEKALKQIDSQQYILMGYMMKDYEKFLGIIALNFMRQN